jgi:prolyl-tRNA synthetase
MSHSDDKGLVLPPVLAPIHVVVVPIFKTEEDLEVIKQYLQPELEKLEKAEFTTKSEFLGNYGTSIQTKFDADTQKSPGRKYNEYELKGIPFRIAIGKRDVENGEIEIYRRDTGEKILVKKEELADRVIRLLEDMQTSLLEQHEQFSKDHLYTVNNYEEFKEKVEQGFVLAHRDGTRETAEKIQAETKATIRCIPFDGKDEEDVDMLTGKKSERRVIFAKSY